MAASYGTWLVCAVPPIAEIAAGRFSGWPAIAWAVSYLLFGAAQAWIVCAPASGRHGQAIRVYLLAAQSITGLVAVALSRNGVTSALLVIVAAQLPHMLTLRRSAIW